MCVHYIFGQFCFRIIFFTCFLNLVYCVLYLHDNGEGYYKCCWYPSCTSAFKSLYVTIIYLNKQQKCLSHSNGHGVFCARWELNSYRIREPPFRLLQKDEREFPAKCLSRKFPVSVRPRIFNVSPSLTVPTLPHISIPSNLQTRRN
jgi:hypothetical protein